MKVFPESGLLHPSAQIVLRGSNDPHINLSSLILTNSFKLILL